jgi:hypothetical protein
MQHCQWPTSQPLRLESFLFFEHDTPIHFNYMGFIRHRDALRLTLTNDRFEMVPDISQAEHRVDRYHAVAYTNWYMNQNAPGKDLSLNTSKVLLKPDLKSNLLYFTTLLRSQISYRL